MLDAAVDDGLILLNPAKKKRTVNPPRSSQVRAQKPEIITWTGPQLHAFLTWNRDELNDELFPLWRTLAYTGMRRSEALALRWSDINFTTGRISLRRAVDVTLPNTTKVTKTGSARVIDIDAETLRVLKAHKSDRGAISLDLARADCLRLRRRPGSHPRPRRRHQSLDPAARLGVRQDRRPSPRHPQRAAAHPRHPAPGARRAPQGRPGTPRTLHDHHDHEHLQPRHPDDAEERHRPLRRAPRRRTCWCLES